MKMALFDVAFWLGAGCGGAVVWFGKDWLIKFVVGSEAFAAKLKAQADAIANAVKKI